MGGRSATALVPSCGLQFSNDQLPACRAAWHRNHDHGTCCPGAKLMPPNKWGWCCNGDGNAWLAAVLQDCASYVHWEATDVARYPASIAIKQTTRLEAPSCVVLAVRLPSSKAATQKQGTMCACWHCIIMA